MTLFTISPPSSVPSITIAYGDGIGPEIMEAVLLVLREAGANLSLETIEVGERIYNQGARNGILPSAWDSLKRTKLLLKGPTFMPEGAGFQSVSDSVCETFGLCGLAWPVAFGAAMPPQLSPRIGAAMAHTNDAFAMFEAAHGAAPKRAGKDTANPSGLLRAALLMLGRIGQKNVAHMVHNAWLKTLQDGIHTRDMAGWKSKQRASTTEFAQAVIGRLGKAPPHFQAMPFP